MRILFSSSCTFFTIIFNYYLNFVSFFFFFLINSHENIKNFRRNTYFNNENSFPLFIYIFHVVLNYSNNPLFLQLFFILVRAFHFNTFSHARAKGFSGIFIVRRQRFQVSHVHKRLNIL